jgi:hypothetical protein
LSDIIHLSDCGGLGNAWVKPLNDLYQDPVGHDQLFLVLQKPSHPVPVIERGFLLQRVKISRNDQGQLGRRTVNGRKRRCKKNGDRGDNKKHNYNQTQSFEKNKHEFAEYVLHSCLLFYGLMYSFML